MDRHEVNVRYVHDGRADVEQDLHARLHGIGRLDHPLGDSHRD
jgi:hypothetical protein